MGKGFESGDDEADITISARLYLHRPVWGQIAISERPASRIQYQSTQTETVSYE